ncbi:MAG TPA: methylmalonyl Co-A mutase-associated GTPase MeaB [Elusimicrobiota bacterium]|nr:methylmalonyl Co-A mutase-associated GTPase MeaB [Elusimicrobiota bacterium]
MRAGSKSSAEALAAAVRAGNRRSLARALSLLINEAPESDVLLQRFFPESGRAHKIGLSGPPGAGKSTLCGRLISHFRGQGLKVGVLAVDPTSPLTGGAFLGDRLRVQEHVSDPGVFMRSLGTRGMVGGVSQTIYGAIHALEAASFSKIIVETVGTGQDEVTIAKVADTVAYVTTPQLGDEIQAMKAGAMEIGDVFVVNKADLGGKDKAVSDLRSALSLGRGREKMPWDPPVVAASAMTGEGVPELGKILESHWEYLKSSGEGRARLSVQHQEELSLYISRRLYQRALDRVTRDDLKRMLEHRSDPVAVARRILKPGRG